MSATATVSFADIVTATDALPVGTPIILSDLTWADYETLLAERGETRRIKFSYFDGKLEVISLSQRHENPKMLLANLVSVLAEELDLMLVPIGSMTLKREIEHLGTEPDDCYYIAHAPQVAGKEIDLKNDPPPDLAVEIDVSRPSLNKFPIYSGMGIPELWLFDGQKLRIYQLSGRQYNEVPNSPQFAFVSAEVITEHLQLGRVTDIVKMRKTFRAWVLENRK
jgi:Uma2 family endonuclease